MRHVSSTQVPHLLAHEQMVICAEVCEEQLEALQEQPDLFEKMITCDKSWVQYFETFTNQESAH